MRTRTHLPGSPFNGQKNTLAPTYCETHNVRKQVEKRAFLQFQCYEIAVPSRQSDSFVSQVAEQKLCFAQVGTPPIGHFTDTSGFEKEFYLHSTKTLKLC